MNEHEYEAYLAVGCRNTEAINRARACPICEHRYYGYFREETYILFKCPYGHQWTVALETYDRPQES